MPAPRNTNPPAATDAASVPAPKVKEGTDDPLAGLSNDGATDFVHVLLEDAQKLADEKVELLRRVDDNRQTLRRIARTGHLSEQQAAAIRLWYPERKKDEQTAEQTAEQATEGAAA